MLLIFVIILILFVIPWDPIPLSFKPYQIILTVSKVSVSITTESWTRISFVTFATVHLKGEVIRATSRGRVYLHRPGFHRITNQDCFVDVFSEDTSLSLSNIFSYVKSTLINIVSKIYNYDINFIAFYTIKNHKFPTLKS